MAYNFMALEFYGLPTILPATDYSGPTLPYYYSQPSYPSPDPFYGMGPTIISPFMAYHFMGAP